MKTPRDEGSAVSRAIGPMSRRALLRGGLLAGAAMLTDALAAVEGSAQAPAQPQISLVQAVRAAEQRTGGRAKKAEIERERGVYVYEIKTVSKDSSAKVHVDPTSGSVLRVSTPGFISGTTRVFDRDDQREDQAAFARLEASSIPLGGAIDLAEKAIGGRAVKAALKSRHGSMLFEASVMKDSTAHKVLIDLATAKVVTSSAHGKHDDD